MQDTIQISDTARVWVYMADRKLSSDETNLSLEAAQEFAKQWAAHGTQLSAFADVKYNRFIILMVDENNHGASGCSIDSSVHFIKALGQKLEVNFFNRLIVAYQSKDESIAAIHQAKLEELYKSGEVTDETIVFNNLVQTKGAFDKEWKVALKDSFYKRLV